VYRSKTDEHAADLQEFKDNLNETLGLISALESMRLAPDVDETTMRAFVDMLNEVNPGSDISYEAVAEASKGYFDFMRTDAKALTEDLETEQKRRQQAVLTGEQAKLQEAKEVAEQNAEIAQAEYDSIKKAQEELRRVNMHSGMPGVSPITPKHIAELNAAEEQLKKYNDDLADTADLYAQNEVALATLEQEIGAYNEAQEAAATSGENIGDMIREVSGEMNNLAAAYEAAYDAALESIEGQYNLWDKADKAVATSAGAINSALESQISYWNEYNADLAELGDRTGDIEGLQEMIATFADGSKESVNAITGMATASDKELATMVKNWKTLQDAQKDAAGEIGDIKVGFTATMEQYQRDIEAFVTETNLTDEAYKNGMLAVEGFALGIEENLDVVRDAFLKMEEISEDALKAAYRIESPSKVMWELGEYAMLGFTGGIAAMKPEVATVMADTAGTGIEAAVPDFGGARGDNITITVSPQYTVTGGETSDELRSVFAENNENLRDLVEDVIRERNINAARRKYN
jgi:hypothetical protein